MKFLFYFARKTYVAICVFSIALLIGCDYSKKNPEQRTYEESYNVTDYSVDEDDPYYNNSLSTGTSPYKNNMRAGDESTVTVRTSSDSKSDLVVIIKKGDVIARNAYIRAGGTYTFNLSNGRYQVFFYSGKGWNPEKEMPNGLRGGFVANESYSKDSPVTLNYEGLTYELILQSNGNFSTQQSNAAEIF